MGKFLPLLFVVVLLGACFPLLPRPPAYAGNAVAAPKAAGQTARGKALTLWRQAADLQNAKKYDEALAKYREGLALSDDARVREHIVKLEDFLARRRAAEAERLERAKKEAYALWTAAGELQNAKKYDEALARYREGLDIFEDAQVREHVGKLEVFIAKLRAREGLPASGAAQPTAKDDGVVPPAGGTAVAASPSGGGQETVAAGETKATPTPAPAPETIAATTLPADSLPEEEAAAAKGSEDMDVLARREEAFLKESELVQERFLKSSSARDLVAASLGEAGPSSIPLLVDFLKDSERSVVEAALESLGVMGADAAPAVPDITLLLKTDDRFLLNDVVNTLGIIGPAAKEAVPALFALLGDKERLKALEYRDRDELDIFLALSAIGMPPLDEERGALVMSLLRFPNLSAVDRVREFVRGMGASALPAITALLQPSRSPDDKVAGLKAAQIVSETADSLLPLVLAASRDEDPKVRREAVNALYRIDKENPLVAERVVEAVLDPDAAVVREAAWWCRFLALGPAPLEEVRKGIETHRNDEEIVAWLVESLGTMGPSALPDIERFAREGGVQEVKGALSALVKMGADGAPMLPLVQEVMAGGQKDVLTHAYRAVAAMGTKEALAVLGEGLSSDEEIVRKAAAKGAARWTGSPEDVLPMLKPLATDTASGPVVASALESLALLDPEGTIPLLVQGLVHEDSSVIEASVECLADLKERALPTLASQLGESSPKARGMAVAVLDEMGFSASPLASTLAELSANDPDERVREISQKALKRLSRLDGVSVPRVALPEVPDLNDLAEEDWQMTVVAARELVRLIMGEMSDEETKKFDAQWEPFLAHPSTELVAYFRKLSGLLNRFVGLRSSLVESGYNFQGATIDAWTAAGYGDGFAFQTALSTAEYCMQFMQGLQKELASVSEQILAMLPLPDPAEMAARTRKRHEEAMALASGADVEEMTQAEWDAGEYWVLVDAQSSVQQGYTQFGAWLETMKTGKKDISFHGGDGIIAGSETGVDDHGKKFATSGSVRWSFPHVLKGEEFAIPFELSIDYSWQDSMGSENWQFASGAWASVSQYDVGGIGSPWEGWQAGGVRALDEGGVRRHVMGPTSVRFKGVVKPYYGELVMEESGEGKRGPRVRFFVHACSPGGRGTSQYIYEKTTLDKESLQKLLDEDRTRRAGIRRTAEEAVAVQAGQAAASREKIDALALCQEQAQYFRTEAEKIRKDLESAKDPESRREFQWRLLVAEANRQREEDAMATAKTGQFVRTRTTYDDYVTVRMAQQSREMADSIALMQRRQDGLERLLRGAPPELREDLRSFAERNRDLSDPEHTRKVIGIVGERIQGYWQGKGAEAEEAAVNAEEIEFYLQMTKMASAMAVTAGAAPLAAGLGASAQVVKWVPMATRIAYGGTTGYLEGGVGEAVRQSLAGISQTTGLAVEAYSGFSKGYESSRGDLVAAVEQGAWSAGQSYVVGKLFEYGVNLSARGLTKAFGPAVQKPLFGMPRPNVQQQFDMARYNQDRERSKSLVKFWQDKQFELNRLTASGVAGPQAERLMKEVQDLTASINADYDAKWLLKHTMPGNVQAAFSRNVDQVYGAVMPEFRSGLKGMGYDADQLEFQVFRNAASAGSVGMDQDIGLKEYRGQRIRKNGRPVSRIEFMEDAQKAWNSAYHKTTGYSASRSDIHITTGAHPEAFADLRLLEKDIDFGQIGTGSIRQASDVFREKARLSMAAVNSSEIGKVQRVCRDIEKEARTKVFKHFDYRIREAALRGNAEQVRTLQMARGHMEEIYSRVSVIGRETSDPYEIYRMQNELKVLTGSNDPVQIMEQMATQFEALKLQAR